MVCLAQISKVRSLDTKPTYAINGLTCSQFEVVFYNSNMTNNYLTEFSHARVSSWPNIINKWQINGNDKFDLTKENHFRLFLVTLQHLNEVKNLTFYVYNFFSLIKVYRKKDQTKHFK